MKSNHQILTNMIAALMDMESFDVAALDDYAHTFRQVIDSLADSEALNKGGQRQYRHTALKIQMEISNGRTEEAFLSLVIAAQSLAADTLLQEQQLAVQQPAAM